MIVIYILAGLGVLDVVLSIAGIVARAIQRSKHPNSQVRYGIFGEDGKTLIWRSGIVEESTSDEVREFKSFCRAWADHPGALAIWERYED